MRVLDMSDDLGAYLKSFVDTLGIESIPDAIKTAEWREPGTAMDRDYALILVDDDGTQHRKYACHDPGSTAVSMLYLSNAYQHDLLNPAAVKVAAANLLRLGHDWGLEHQPAIAKLASIDLPLGAKRDILDERRVVFRPPRVAHKTAETGPFVKLAECRRTWHDKTPHERRASALELAKEASSVPIVVPPEVFRYSGEGLSPKFASHMRQRTAYTSNAEVAAGYEQLAKIASLFPPDGVVDAVYALDDAARLRWAGGDRYGERLPDPVLCVYGRVKEAAYGWNHGADFVTEHDLITFVVRENARKLFTDVFADDLWWPFEKDPVGRFKALPLEHKKLVSRMAREE